MARKKKEKGNKSGEDRMDEEGLERCGEEIPQRLSRLKRCGPELVGSSVHHKTNLVERVVHTDGGRLEEAWAGR